MDVDSDTPRFHRQKSKGQGPIHPLVVVVALCAAASCRDSAALSDRPLLTDGAKELDRGVLDLGRRDMPSADHTGYDGQAADGFDQADLGRDAQTSDRSPSDSNTQMPPWGAPWDKVLFEDDFEAQAADWNLGQGPLITPVSQLGQWGILESNRKTCAELGCGACSSLPTHADGYVTHLDPTGGVNGGKALRWVMKRGCAVRQYPGSIDWRLPVATYRDVYFGFDLKVDPAWKTTGAQQCKFPLWVALGENRLEGKIWVVNRNMTMPGDSQIELFHLTATPNNGWFRSGISDREFADGRWHRLEFHIRLNQAEGSGDGEMRAWFDGQARGSIDNLTFWPSTGSNSRWIYAIRLQLGNCSANVEDWANEQWAGFWIDNFRGTAQ